MHAVLAKLAVHVFIPWYSGERNIITNVRTDTVQHDRVMCGSVVVL